MMTEKRFAYVNLLEVAMISDKLDEAYYFNCENCTDEDVKKVVDLLNKLNDENEQLKQENDKYRVMINANASLNDEVYEQLKKTEKSYKECREENEQLRQRNDQLSRKIEYLHKVIRGDELIV